MKSLYESILDRLEESILGSNNAGISAVFVDNVVRITKSYYDKTISDEDKLLLERLWKEHDLEIPGMKWYFTRYEGMQYGPAEGLCVPIVQILNEGSVCISIHSRVGIDYAIKNLNLPRWEDVAKKETKKMTDAFLKRYSKKLSKVLNMKPIEGESEYFISRYELN